MASEGQIHSARRLGFVGEPRNSSCSGIRARVRRSIGVFGRRLHWHRARTIASRGCRLGPRDCHGRPAGRRRQTNPLRSRSRQGHPVSCLYPGRSLPGGGRYSPDRFPVAGRSRHCEPWTGQGFPLWHGDAGRLADRVRFDWPRQNRRFLRARCSQRPAIAAGAGNGGGRPCGLQSGDRNGKHARA